MAAQGTRPGKGAQVKGGAVAAPGGLLAEVRIATRSTLKGWPLRMPDAASPEESQALVAREALRWTYVLRSRRRWVGGSRARERNEEEARATLQPIGIAATQLDDMAASEVVVVRIPYTTEAMHWESRIFPWEYVLAAATRERRLRRGKDHDEGGDAAGVRPAPLTVMRELQIQTPLRHPLPDPRRVFAGGLRALFIECLPSELREHWSMDDERKRLRAALPADAQWRVLSFPTRHEVVEQLRSFRPQLVHFAGLDSHQGVRELRLHVGQDALLDVWAPEKNETGEEVWGNRRWSVDQITADSRVMLDGLILRGDTPEDARARGDQPESSVSYPRLVAAQELAELLASSGHTAYLMSFNQWNTSARVAPLVVAERATLAALGFQDAFDDALSEWVHATMWRQLLATGANLPEAFRQTWSAVRELPESVDATGITLWAGAPLLGRPRAAAPPPAARPGAPAGEPGFRWQIEPLPELNYAVLHNAQPMFSKFVLECDRPSRGLMLDVDVSVHMGAEQARFQRQVHMNHERVALTHDIHVPLTAGVARAVREAISSSLQVVVRHGHEVLYRDTHRLRLLPVDQWRDNRRDGRWLPSFVQPRDAAVTAAVAAAQRYVRVLRDDPSAGFEGYQLATPGDEESLRGVDRQVEAIWATLLHEWQLGYINPPPSYSSTLDSQRLRTPSTVRDHRAGTCIDLALLFASCLELVDIYPVVFLLDGHALPGWWRHGDYRDEYFQMPVANFNDVSEGSATVNNVANAQVVAWHTGKASWREIRRWIRERKLVPIETVRLTEHCGFAEAIEAGVQALAERSDFDSMLDIITARSEGVTPLPIAQEVP